MVNTKMEDLAFKSEMVYAVNDNFDSCPKTSYKKVLCEQGDNARCID